MSATGRSYTRKFFKVQYIIIQAILSPNSMKKFSVSIRLLTVKENNYTGLRTSHAQFLRKAVSMKRKTLKIKFCHKKEYITG